MLNKDGALDMLRGAGALDAVAWSWASSVWRTSLDYDPDTGHDQVWLGLTAHKLFRDRLDRVFSCGKYAVDPLHGEEAGLDVVGASLQPTELERMPKIKPGLIIRADENGSPGWHLGGLHWLLSSFAFSGIDEIAWSEKKPTKQRAASQPPPIDLEEGLFPLIDLGVSVEEMTRSGKKFETTLIVAHSINSDATESELYVGQARLNPDRDLPWHWREKISSAGFGGPAGMRPTVPVPPGPDTDDVPDATVRLKPTTKQIEK